MTTKGSNLSDEKAKELRQKVRDAIKVQTDATMKTAELLYAVCYGTVRQGNADVPLAVAWGYDDFDDFAERELEMHETNARGLVMLYEELCHKRSFDPGMLPNSITKLRKLARMAKHCRDDRQLRSWIAKSKDMSCCELDHAAEEEFGIGSSRLKRLGFTLKLSHYTTLLRKLRVARESFGVHSNGLALSKIVDEWTEMHERDDRVRTKKRAS